MRFPLVSLVSPRLMSVFLDGGLAGGSDAPALPFRLYRGGGVDLMIVEFIFSLLPAGESESSASSESGSESGSWTSRSDDSTATSSGVEIIEDLNAPSPEDHDESPGSDAEGGVSPMPLFSYVCTVAFDWI